MPENPTIEEVTKKLENLIRTSEICGLNVIASLWISEAKVILEYIEKGKQYDSLC